MLFQGTEQNTGKLAAVTKSCGSWDPLDVTASTDHVRTASLLVSGGISDWESRALSLSYTSKMKENNEPLKMASSECL